MISIHLEWYYPENTRKGAKQRIQKWIGFGGARWHLCGEDRLAVSYPAFIDSLQSQSPLEGLCRDTDICAIVEKAKQEKTAEWEHTHSEMESVLSWGRHGVAMALCEAVVAECGGKADSFASVRLDFSWAIKPMDMTHFLNWNNGTSHYFIVTFLFLITYLLSPSSRYSCIYVYFFPYCWKVVNSPFPGIKCSDSRLMEKSIKLFLLLENWTLT